MKPLSILVVDDNAALCETVALALRRAWHVVTCAGDADTALRLLRTQSFEVLLTDILLGERDGVELIRVARGLNSEIRIVAMSGGGEFLTASYCLNLAMACGACAPLMKPFTHDQLLAAVEGTAVVLPAMRA